MNALLRWLLVTGTLLALVTLGNPFDARLVHGGDAFFEFLKSRAQR